MFLHTLHTYTKTLLLTGGISLIALSSAQAQFVPSADPSRVQDQLQTETQPQAADGQVITPPSLTSDVPASFKDITFTLEAIQFDGMSVYDQEQVADLYSDKVGQKVSLAEIVRVANALTLQYRNDGYLLSRAVVPTQEINDGSVTIKVFEGYIDQVQIEQEGDVAGGTALIERLTERLNRPGPVRTRDLESALLLSNDLPGVSIRTIITPSQERVGAADLRLIVTQERDLFTVAANNRGTRYLGPLQVFATYQLNSPFKNHGRLTADYVTAWGGDQELGYYGLSYDTIVHKSGTQLNIGGSYADTDPGFTLSQFDVEGESTSAFIGLEQPLIRTRRENLSVYGLFDYLNSENDATITLLEYEDKVRTLRVGARYNFVDGYKGFNRFNVEVSQGLDILGASEEGDDVSRANGDPEFTKIYLEASRVQALPHNASLVLATKAQKSAHTLLSSEEFGIGGARFGRAYDPSEVVGEDGVVGSLEVNKTYASPYAELDSYQLYGFYDIGAVWNDDAAQDKESLSSAGAGVRAVLFGGANASFEVSKPLTRDVDTQGDDDVRLFGNVSFRF